jgi:hypothetical protein
LLKLMTDIQFAMALERYLAELSLAIRQQGA